MGWLNKIVVCDDEDAIAHLVQMALGDAGFLCLRARDGEQAMFLARVESPDLLVLDVMMPKVDGVHACRELKADPHLARIPILLLTALSSVNDKVQGFDAGADDYLTKPFDLRELVARVKALLRASRRAQEASPLTGLHGAAALTEVVEAHLAEKRPFVLLHATLGGYESFVEAEGWRRGEELIGAVGKTLAQTIAPGDDVRVLGHLGGSDFALVVGREGAAKLSARLRDAVAEARASYGARSVRLDVTLVDGSEAESADGLARAVAQKHRRSATGQSGPHAILDG